MKLLLIADLHLKEDRYGLLDLKLDIGKSLLQKLASQVDYVIVAGDTQDTRGGYDSYLATKEAEMYNIVGDDVLKRIFVLTGNHDSRLRDYHPISPFGVRAPINIVADQTKVISDGTSTVVIQGWNGGDKLPEPDAIGNVYYVGHLHVKDLVGKGVSLDEINASSYTRVISGDYHEFLERGKFVSIGTLFPSSFSDKDYEPGFLIFDTNTNTFQRHILPSRRYPRFKVFKTNIDLIGVADVEDNIVRLKIQTDTQVDRKQTAEIKKRILDRGARYVDIQYEMFNREPDIEITTDDPNELLKIEAEAQGWTESQTNWAKKLMSNFV